MAASSSQPHPSISPPSPKPRPNSLPSPAAVPTPIEGTPRRKTIMTDTTSHLPITASPLGAHRSPTKTPSQPNVANVVLGHQFIRPWYPSFYPEDLLGGKKTEWLYVCQWCFKYTGEILKYSAHCKVCPLKHAPPPGNVIYECEEYVIRRFDGEGHKLYAQNLSLFAKLFLDTKSVFFDVGTFWYFVLVLKGKDRGRRDGEGGFVEEGMGEDEGEEDEEKGGENEYGQVVGFFSKEKMSWDNNNLACILVFPPWLRKGLGQVLIAASYELGRREKRFGGPERPLSVLGRKGYVAFWCGEICRYFLKSGTKRTVTIQDISDDTYIPKEDLVMALREMDVLENRKTPSGSCVIHKSRVQEWVKAHRISKEPVVDVDAFVEYEEDDGLSESESEDG